MTPRSFVLVMQRRKRPNVPNGLIRSMQKSYETQDVSLKKRNVDATSTDDIRLTGSGQPVVQHPNRCAAERKRKKPSSPRHSALLLTISASKGAQMYHINDLPFRLRENSFAVTRRRSSQTARNIGGRFRDSSHPKALLTGYRSIGGRH